MKEVLLFIIAVSIIVIASMLISIDLSLYILAGR